MEDIPIAKGGRGRVAPYSTCHYRIPQPIKPTVERLAGAYRLCIEEVREPEAMLKRVEQAIDPKASELAPSQLEDQHKIEQLQKELGAIEEQNEISAKLLNHVRRDKQESSEEAAQLISQQQTEIERLNKELKNAQEAIASEVIASQVSDEITDSSLEQENLELHVKVGDLGLALQNAQETIENLKQQISQESEAPQLSAYEEALQTAVFQENVIEAFQVDNRKAERLLTEALALKANAGGAIKAKIKQALLLISIPDRD